MRPRDSRSRATVLHKILWLGSVPGRDQPTASARRVGRYACAVCLTPAGMPIGQLTPVPPRPQYPIGFFAKYCWW